MPTCDRRTLLFSSLAACLPGEAGAAPPPRTPSLFQQVIPHPTGQNGYEELVAAAEELRKSKVYQEAERLSGTPEGVPLASKRRAMADGPVIRAFTLLKRGLSKPIASPRTTLSPA